MTGKEFVQELRDKVKAFCATLDDRPPAYSYVPLSTDEARVRVMKSRLWNELRAADLFGGWLRTTPEIEVKTMMARSAHEEMVHAGLLSARIRELAADPFDYRPLPAQMSMFNAMEGLPDSCQRLAGFSMGGEGIANYLIEKCLAAPSSRTGSRPRTGASWPTRRGTAQAPRESWSVTPPPRRSRTPPAGPWPCAWC